MRCQFTQVEPVDNDRLSTTGRRELDTDRVRVLLLNMRIFHMVQFQESLHAQNLLLRVLSVNGGRPVLHACSS